MTALERAAPVAWLTDRETMHFDKEDAWRDCDGFIQPLYTEPAKLAQEPIAIRQFRKKGSTAWQDGHVQHLYQGNEYEKRTLYTEPPRRKWLGLTDKEIRSMPCHETTVRYFESVLKGKNT